jgi:hypothetical protein
VYASIDGHRALVERLDREHPDGWALSMASVDISAMAMILPRDVRWGSWVKTFASFKPGVNPGYAWEPVAFRGGRALGRDVDTVRDFLACPIALKKGLAGAKPPRFCAWILDMLGFQAGDTCDDIFPGTGVFSRVRDDRIGALSGVTAPLVLL